jgi:hypothetical protein
MPGADDFLLVAGPALRGFFPGLGLAFSFDADRLTLLPSEIVPSEHCPHPAFCLL